MEYPTSGPAQGVPALSTPLALSANSIQSITEEVRKALRQELADAGLAPLKKVELAGRWEGGELLLKPGKEGAQEKAIPIEQFFRKIVNMREQLRNLEREINNHPKLNDEERLELQQYLTRIYGSMTTFNILFSEKLDQFVGQSSRR